MRFGRRGIDSFLSGEHDSVGYLFRKRWPHGFTCPFCGNNQPAAPPALSVVCPLCRKQTSITARTVLHGTRKSLLNWLRLCWLFCTSDDGISAREVQQLMALSSYQSAWNWLQKLRQAASIAEDVRCMGTVLIDVAGLVGSTAPKEGDVLVCIAVEVDAEKQSMHRFRCQIVNPTVTPAADGSKTGSRNHLWAQNLGESISSLVAEDAVVLVPRSFSCTTVDWIEELALGKPSFSVGEEFTQFGRRCTDALAQWLLALYRGAVDIRYLQGYVDEFTFRWNRRACQDKMQLFDELVSCLVTPVVERQRSGKTVHGDNG